MCNQKLNANQNHYITRMYPRNEVSKSTRTRTALQHCRTHPKGHAPVFVTSQTAISETIRNLPAFRQSTFLSQQTGTFNQISKRNRRNVSHLLFKLFAPSTTSKRYEQATRHHKSRNSIQIIIWKLVLLSKPEWHGRTCGRGKVMPLTKRHTFASGSVQMKATNLHASDKQSNTVEISKWILNYS